LGFLESLSPILAKTNASELVPGKSASVALIFHGSRTKEEILLITRAERAGDPWSGQVAFPGGMVEESDTSFEETARRETMEEVGVDLGEGSFVGYMREFEARRRPVRVVPSVFKVDEAPDVRMNGEVAAFEWVPLARLARKEAMSKYRVQRHGATLEFPALVYGGLLMWGLTERIISTVLAASSRSLGRA